MKTLLLLAMLQVPQDTIRTEFVIPLPRQAQDPVPVIVESRVEIPWDSVRTLMDAGAARSERALALAIAEQCGCVDSGPPDWFWLGTLLVTGYAVYVWSQKDDDDPDTVFNVQGGAGGEGGSGGEGGDGGGHGHGHPHHGHGKPKGE